MLLDSWSLASRIIFQTTISIFSLGTKLWNLFLTYCMLFSSSNHLSDVFLSNSNLALGLLNLSFGGSNLHLWPKKIRDMFVCLFLYVWCDVLNLEYFILSPIVFLNRLSCIFEGLLKCNGTRYSTSPTLMFYYLPLIEVLSYGIGKSQVCCSAVLWLPKLELRFFISVGTIWITRGLAGFIFIFLQKGVF